MMRCLLATCLVLVPLRFAPAQESALPPDMVQLIPADSIALVQLRSANELARHVQAVQSRVSPGGDAFEAEMLLAMMLGSVEFPGDVTKLDLGKPLAIALTFSLEGPEPVPTFILPSTD